MLDKVKRLFKLNVCLITFKHLFNRKRFRNSENSRNNLVFKIEICQSLRKATKLNTPKL